MYVYYTYCSKSVAVQICIFCRSRALRTSAKSDSSCDRPQLVLADNDAAKSVSGLDAADDDDARSARVRLNNCSTCMNHPFFIVRRSRSLYRATTGSTSSSTRRRNELPNAAVRFR